MFEIEKEAESISDHFPPGRNIERDVLRLVIVPNELEGFVQFILLLLCVMDGGKEVFELFAGGYHGRFF